MLIAVRNVLGAALLVGLAALTWTLGRPSLPDEREARPTSDAASGYYLRNATLFGTDAEGRIYYRLRAAGVEQQADDGALRFSDLTVEYDPQFDVHWQLRAVSGRTGETPDTLLLSDGVRLEIAATETSDAMSIEADSLTLDTAGSRVTTPDRVSLAHGRTRFEATGLTADLALDQIDLHANVSARIVP